MEMSGNSSEAALAQPNPVVPVSTPTLLRFEGGSFSSTLLGRKRALGQGFHSYVNGGKAPRAAEVRTSHCLVDIELRLSQSSAEECPATQAGTKEDAEGMFINDARAMLDSSSACRHICVKLRKMPLAISNSLPMCAM